MPSIDNPHLTSGGYFFCFNNFPKYNGGMEKKNYYDQCEKCGRRFPKAEPCKCSFNNCCMTEYRHKVNGCIRNKNPECPYNAVIASVTVETIDGISNLADCFVHVISTNTTYYIDDKHRPIIVWAGPVEVDLPADIQTQEEFDAFVKSHDLHSQFLYVKFHLTDPDPDQDIIEQFYFNKNGDAFYGGEFYPIDGGLI